MYEGIKRAFGPITTKKASMKTSDGVVITDPNKQMERWIGHLPIVYIQNRNVAIDVDDQLPIYDNLPTPTARGMS